MQTTHTISPVYDANSRILMLGSFPSVASREGAFFYHHPQNRFWKVIAYLCQEKVPTTIAEKKQVLHTHHLAVWDVIHRCDVIGSSDQSIKEIEVNDLLPILTNSAIAYIVTNGSLATKLYHQHWEPITGIQAIALPSTSAANAQYSLERLQNVWQEKIGPLL